MVLLISQDTLSASANILTHYSAALSQYASHGHRMRDQLKAIRREEALDDLKRRRRSVMSSADSADKKLRYPENNLLLSQQETLNRLRNKIRALDADIMAEESSLGDFKRSQVKMMMGLKFGGLLECSEKGIVRMIHHPAFPIPDHTILKDCWGVWQTCDCGACSLNFDVYRID